MVSEINSSSASVVTALDNRATRIDKPASPAATGAAPNPDVVTLTDLGGRLQALTQSVADVPAVDRSRVESFRQSIADGSYQVDPTAVADKLANFEALLASAPQAK